MASEISNNTDILGSDIRNLREQLNRARSHVQQLNDQMEELNHMWKGPAHDAVQKQFVKDFQTISELCASLERMADNLESTRRAYERCESNVSSAVFAIHIG